MLAPDDDNESLDGYASDGNDAFTTSGVNESAPDDAELNNKLEVVDWLGEGCSEAIVQAKVNMPVVETVAEIGLENEVIDWLGEGSSETNVQPAVDMPVVETVSEFETENVIDWIGEGCNEANVQSRVRVPQVTTNAPPLFEMGKILDSNQTNKILDRQRIEANKVERD